MPIKRFRVALDLVGRTPLVESSNVVNAVSVTKLSPGAEFSLDLGNMRQTSPITARGELEIDPFVGKTDRSEGLAVINETAQAGLEVWLTVSYQRGNEPPNRGIVYRSAS